MPVAIRSGDFDEWSNVAVQSDVHFRREIMKRFHNRTVTVTGGDTRRGRFGLTAHKGEEHE
jgi:hypothetical protein